MTPIFRKTMMYICLGCAIINEVGVLINLSRQDIPFVLLSIFFTVWSLGFAYMWSEYHE